MEAVGKFFVTLFISALTIFSRGWATVFLWRWFVVPTFHLSPLTWATAYGLALLIGVLHPTSWPKKDAKESYAQSVASSIGSGIVGPWLLVAIGWSIHALA